MKTQTVELVIRDSQRTPVAAELTVEDLTNGQRLLRALSRLGFCWGLALPSVFIPLLHFVLVPGLVLLGPIVAWLAGKATVVVKSEKVRCPKCEAPAPIEPGTTGWPIRLWCASCGTTFSARERAPSS